MAETQPALATTKRKFHRIMENIAANTSTTSVASSLQASNASTTSLAYPATPEPPNKRPRSSNANEERERSISASQARIQALKDQLLTPRREGTVRAVGKSIAPKASTPRKQPNFQPYSQEQFLQRLKTFADVKKWTSKPDAIGEVEWAKRGWTCDTWNTVACKGGCEKRVAVKLRPKRKDVDGKDVAMTEDLGADVDARLVEKFRELIQTGHAEDCLWRKRGCHGVSSQVPFEAQMANYPQEMFIISQSPAECKPPPSSSPATSLSNPYPTTSPSSNTSHTPTHQLTTSFSVHPCPYSNREERTIPSLPRPHRRKR
jgi:hypothetical protein